MSAAHPTTRRLGFAGTPEFAAHILRSLLESNQVPEIILTQPDRPRGRGRRSQPSEVKQLAEEWALAVHEPQTLKTSASQDLLKGLDLLVVAAYGLLLPENVLSIPRLGCVNVHASLLPRWRGAAPIERAIMAGDTLTGVTLMQMDAGLDTGDIIASVECPITADMTGDQLHEALARLGGELLVSRLPDIEHQPRLPQPMAGVTYARKLTTAEAEIDWGDTSKNIVNRVRALYSRMPAFSFLGTGKRERVRILKAVQVSPGPCNSARDQVRLLEKQTQSGTIVSSSGKSVRVVTGDGFLDILEVQLAKGKGRPMSVGEAINGYPVLFQEGSSFFSSSQSLDSNAH